MTIPHWNFDSSTQHVHCSKELHFLINSLCLVWSTSVLCILPIHGKNMRFKWFWRRHDCGCRKGRFQFIRNRWLTYLAFLIQECLEFPKNCMSQKTSSYKWNCEWKLLVNNRGARRLTHIVCSSRSSTPPQSVVWYNSVNTKLSISVNWS